VLVIWGFFTLLHVPPPFFSFFSARIQTFTFDVIFLLHIRIAMPSFRKAVEYRE